MNRETYSSSLHSSRPSMTITVLRMSELSKGSRIDSLIWCEQGRLLRSGRLVKSIKFDRNPGYLYASWKARVGNIDLRSLRFSDSREQKKEAPSRPSLDILSAIVCAIALFPVPTGPFNQKRETQDSSSTGSRAQWSIWSRMALRVPRRQEVRFPRRYSASLT